MARTWTGTATTNAAALTITGGPIREIYVQNTGAVTLNVNVPVIHSTDYDEVAAGDTGRYAVDPVDGNKIDAINVKSASSTCTYRAGVTCGTN